MKVHRQIITKENVKKMQKWIAKGTPTAERDRRQVVQTLEKAEISVGRKAWH